MVSWACARMDNSKLIWDFGRKGNCALPGVIFFWRTYISSFVCTQIFNVDSAQSFINESPGVLRNTIIPNVHIKCLHIYLIFKEIQVTKFVLRELVFMVIIKHASY